jgi:hypothetical protein
MSPESLVDEARRLMADGKSRRAADMLITAASGCQDPELAARIRDLGQDGLDRAGRFGKGPWKEVVRIAGARAGTPV